MVPAVPPQILISPSISPQLRHVPAAQTTPLPLPSALIQRPIAPVHQSRVRASCVCASYQYTSFDPFSFIFPPPPAPVPASHSPVHPTTSPSQRTLCAGSFVSHPLVSRVPSLHHLPTHAAYHSYSPRSLSLKPLLAARAVEHAIA